MLKFSIQRNDNPPTGLAASKQQAHTEHVKYVRNK